ncbi:MAG: hypothetical protein ACQCXQ_13955 [Verrucomicrobiales bacterium]|nr:hypothetical protein [Verrucomicrobiota bacterium JB025]
MKAVLLTVGLMWCAASAHGGPTEAAAVTKPVGAYASMLTGRAVENDLMQGGLVRVLWAELEPSRGEFDFAPIETQLRRLPQGKKWSLALYGGWASIEADDPGRVKTPPLRGGSAKQRPLKPHMSPPWLVSELGAETFVIQFRGTAVNLPKYWDPVVQKRLAVMMQAVAGKYQEDERLALIYVPQMTSNGLEGHFNGVPKETLLAAADLKPTETREFEKLWTGAALSAIRSTAAAFPNKAVAFEVHELLGSAAIPKQIMSGILADPALSRQAGIAMWWISGKTDYQAELLAAIEKFPGDLYGQVIGRSDQSHRFPGGDYKAVFTQAAKLGMRYIEPWNYEFEHHTHDDLLEEFNRSCAQRFAP